MESRAREFLYCCSLIWPYRRYNYISRCGEGAGLTLVCPHSQKPEASVVARLWNSSGRINLSLPAYLSQIPSQTRIKLHFSYSQPLSANRPPQTRPDWSMPHLSALSPPKPTIHRSRFLLA